MNIRRSTIEDKGRIEELYQMARAGMKELGIDQWQDGHPNGEDFERDLSNGISSVYEKDGTVIGTAAAYIGHDNTYDKIYDGEWLTNNETYGIIHRITVDPNLRKSGVAGAFIEYVKDMCIKEGITSMRCDTHRDNKIMQHTLEKNGYKKCGTIIIEDGTERFAYEKLI